MSGQRHARRRYRRHPTATISRPTTPMSAAGQTMTVDGSDPASGEDFTFNGSAETNGSFFIYAGQGVDTLTGGARQRRLLLQPGPLGAATMSTAAPATTSSPSRRLYGMRSRSRDQMFTNVESSICSRRTTAAAGGGTDFTYTSDDGRRKCRGRPADDDRRLGAPFDRDPDLRRQRRAGRHLPGVRRAGDDTIIGSHGDDISSAGSAPTR